ncbi:hypothetical protein ALC62_16021 [Cyphomyrmex costatus]|uniref:Uncharacterized protein n=1 Tax=Cyphomyrmex costatus TaxID=456900 RepID=A0A151I6E0_9HYME|nr:hypothetical protein ALC62_16021 [Cyphomyrmex costatus]
MARKAKELQQDCGFGSSPNPRPSRTLSDSVTSDVIAFYNSDEISRIMPGRKDYVTIRNTNGEKDHIQKRLILCNLKEAYVQFKSEKPEVKVGFTKFAELRPKHCIVVGPPGTHTVCVCKTHQNVKLMLAGINSVSRSYKKSYHDFLKKITCETPGLPCYLNECGNCPKIDIVINEIEQLFEENFVENLTYSRWTQTDRSTLENVVMPSEEFIDILKESLEKLKTHNFIAKEQSAYMQHCKINLQPGEFLVLGDFAENYAFVVQDEIQSFHWNNNQATIHPFVVYYRDENEIKHLSFVVISEDLHHNTVAVHLFQHKLIVKLKSEFGSANVKRIIYFSDGASAQYKNKSNFINLTHHENDFEVKAEWHFFASSHGKNPCDGLGGTIKRLAARTSLQRTNTGHILTPKDLYEWAHLTLKSMSFAFCTIQEHENEKTNLESRFKTAITIHGTRQFHAFIPLTTKRIQCKIISRSENMATLKIMH